MIRFLLCLPLLMPIVLCGQAWETRGISTLSPQENNDVIVTTGPQPGMVFHRQLSRPDSDRWWFMADSWNLGEVDQADLFFVFGRSLPDTTDLYACGYSAVRDQIELHRIAIRNDSLIELSLLARKAVEIISSEQKYVLKLIFEDAAQSLQMEINGVPMKTAAPIPPGTISIAGYLLSENATARFRQIRIHGDKR